MSTPVHDPLADDKRPDVFDIWKSTRFNVKTLCKTFFLKRSLVLAIMRNQPVTCNDAEKVLHALDAHVNQDYSLKTVKVQLIDDTRKETRP